MLLHCIVYCASYLQSHVGLRVFSEVFRTFTPLKERLTPLLSERFRQEAQAVWAVKKASGWAAFPLRL